MSDHKTTNVAILAETTDGCAVNATDELLSLKYMIWTTAADDNTRHSSIVHSESQYCALVSATCS